MTPLALLLLSLPTAWSSFVASPSVRTHSITAATPTANPQIISMLAKSARGDGRRSTRVGQVIRSELATLIREGNVRGDQKIPAGLQQLISIVDVDLSPDLRNARVKVSIIGDRKDKVSAVRWLRGNVRGLRHQLAQRNRQMRSIPRLTFDHVDVGAATDIMITLERLRRESEAKGLRDGLDDEDDAAEEDDEYYDEEEEEEEEEATVTAKAGDDQDAWLDGEDDDDFLWDDDEEE